MSTYLWRMSPVYTITLECHGELQLSMVKQKNMWSIHRKKYKHIIAVLVETRHEAGVTQKELARRLHLRQNIISKIETCQRRIDLLELINYLGGVECPLPKFMERISNIIK